MPSTGDSGSRKRWLPLRGGRDRIELIRVNTAFRPRIVLGTTQGAHEGARASSRAEHTESTPEVATRPKDATAIKLPLPTREQTALFFEVGPKTQATLRGMVDDGSNGRAETVAEPVEPRSRPDAERVSEAESKRARVADARETEHTSGEQAEELRARHARIKT